ncbi:TetR/AcrR family transcriptional regulator [Lichenicola cladoniae]|uniref:TetR/AcrR family transcriptional regulator n=1 Tax=Lichenicola cladoniae TaxID=1484109 RepID=A0A6M8HQ92_9PROT|nr:TetR/AcrR family transcriptional regulator [Lichenicola cladoniae]NPD68011.1 TetR/AcrR family transcriptional regulator [Acetobacteraceae bacterium]QKE90594.1 TetR/AcrR family transcriptional regulator [Lichenicola cladoniae]
MSSHIARPKVALPPIRLRGRQRVAIILDAAASVFAEKGVEAATMTEIAARSGTAIGSLYRFFPAKELLADALFARYAETILSGLTALADTAVALGPFGLAEALLALILSQRPDRDAAVAIAEMRDDGAALRAGLRDAIREHLEVILTVGGLAPDRAKRAAPVVLQAMKALPLLVREGIDEMATMAELRSMIGLYLQDAAVA